MQTQEPVKYPSYDLSGLSFEKCVIGSPVLHIGYYMIAGCGEQPDITQLRTSKQLNVGDWHHFVNGMGFRRM